MYHDQCPSFVILVMNSQLKVYGFLIQFKSSTCASYLIIMNKETRLHLFDMPLILLFIYSNGVMGFGHEASIQGLIWIFWVYPGFIGSEGVNI